MYGLVERERDAALAKLDRRDPRFQRQSPPRRREGSLSPTRGGGGGDDRGLGGGGSGSTLGGGGGGGGPGPEVEALALAAAAIDSVTKADVSEIRSFRAPPPAVAMVTSALMILLEVRPPGLAV